MQAIINPLTKIINGTMQFVIPVFQRDYSWSEVHCEQLWNDVLTIGADTTGRNHFLGSVVYVATGDSSAAFTRWLLIDGQQRLTTLTLLLTALRDHLRKSGSKGSETGPSVERVEAYYLKNVHEAGDRQYKLMLRRHDQESLKTLLDGTELPPKDSERVKENYEFFREQLVNANVEQVWRGIGRLVVVDVTLEHGADDPQLIFESLNSTGLDLSQSDLIRNFILMRLSEKEQTRLYETYWCRIERLFHGSERTFDDFVWDYIALRTQVSKQEKADEIYFAFRRYFASIGHGPEQPEALLGELLKFARYYAAFSVEAEAPAPLREAFARLRKLVDVPAILVMRLYELFDDLKSISLGQLCEAIGILESYIFRRAICDQQTRGYWQVFANLAYRLDAERPLDSLKVGLARLHESYRFPEEEEFRKALEQRDLYHTRVNTVLLDRLENDGSKEPTDTSKYTIEHILPQNERLGAEWREMLGKDWRDVQKVWVHRLGNLTLTGYNSTYSDRPFNAKKSIPGGFEESSVRLNRFVREQDVWTAAEIERRGKALARRALAIWPMLAVDKKLVDAAEEAEMRARASRRDVNKVKMTAPVRDLFGNLREALLDREGDIIEVAEEKSVSYHGPEFFLEVLPRSGRLVLLLPLHRNEVDDPIGIALDASEKKFFANAKYEGGVFLRIKEPEDIPRALPMIHQARERANS